MESEKGKSIFPNKHSIVTKTFESWKYTRDPISVFNLGLQLRGPAWHHHMKIGGHKANMGPYTKKLKSKTCSISTFVHLLVNETKKILKTKHFWFLQKLNLYFKAPPVRGQGINLVTNFLAYEIGRHSHMRINKCFGVCMCLWGISPTTATRGSKLL